MGNNRFTQTEFTYRKLVGILLYTVASTISIWATSESIHTSFSLPKIVSYVIGITIIGILGVILSVIRKQIIDRDLSIKKLLIPLVFFIAFWILSLVTNIHKFFNALKLEDIRKIELVEAISAFRVSGENQQKYAENQSSVYYGYVNQKIDDWAREIINPQRPGPGPVSDSIKTKVENALEQTIPIPSGYSRSKNDLRKLSRNVSNDMRNRLDVKYRSMLENIKTLADCKDPAVIDSIISTLESYNNFKNDFGDSGYKETISNAHLAYKQMYDCYDFGILSVNRLSALDSITFKSNHFINPLELPVPSIELEKISELLPFIRNYPKKEPGAYFSAFYLCAAFAFLFDVAAFLSLYLVVLKDED